MVDNTKKTSRNTDIKMAKGEADPAWLRSLKRESDRLGIPIRELLAQHDIKKPTTAAKGGVMKKAAYAKGGMPKKKGK
jgi:hypothetical protein